MSKCFNNENTLKRVSTTGKPWKEFQLREYLRKGFNYRNVLKRVLTKRMHWKVFQ